MTTDTLSRWANAAQFAFSDPKLDVEFNGPSPLLSLVSPEFEEIDADWWEPRHDQPWRRQHARERQHFGGEYVARAKSPVEGPNNPARLARELDSAERSLDKAAAVKASAESDAEEARARVAYLRHRLEAAA